MAERKRFDLGALSDDDAAENFEESAYREVFDSGIHAIKTSEHQFVIRAADSQGQRNKAAMLINKMYSWRGYGDGHDVDARPDQVALVATDFREGNAIGTLTVSLDSPRGMLVDRLYRPDVDRLRSDGRRVCEMIKFAVDRSVRSKAVLASLFHVSFIYAYHLSRCTDLLIEVTPQHAVFYRHQLHFEKWGEEKLNPRVNVVGVLLRLNLEHAAEQIRKFGGQGEASTERSLYPYAFSEKEEAGVIERLRRIETDPDPQSAAPAGSA